jgi:NADH:ubiquinone oxidoreductase subunit 5 (subunit L)/multisubunit Na+/H+ antiporter MnhA subunit
MLVGVWSSNLLQLIIGWEGVGIMSYLLINFYDFRSEANKSAMKALLVNKIGDIGFLAGIVMSYTIFSTIKINNINNLAYYFKNELTLMFLKTEINYLTIVTVVFLIGASTKSAQLLLNV